MKNDEQTRVFESRLKERFPGSDPRVMQGASNRPSALRQGFRLGVYNLEHFDSSPLLATRIALVLGARLILPRDAVLHLAVAFEGDSLLAFARRLQALRADGGRVNNTRVYLHANGAYLVEKGDLDEIDPSDGVLGEPIRPTVAVFADIERPGALESVEVAYVDYLRTLLGPTPLQRLGADATTGGAALDPATIEVQTIIERIASLGGVFEPSLIHRYHVALNHLARKHFVLLTGISGTGKTLLSKCYAYAILGAADLAVGSDEFHLIAVRPDWAEPSPLLGFRDAITGRYTRTRFLAALLRAVEQPHRPMFVCLDEMNLAQPEHYFADLMSAMETGEDLVLHDSDPAVVGVPRRIPWPRNLFLTGTVNVDETTRRFSPKLLDRAQVIDMSQVDVDKFCGALKLREPTLAPVLGNEFVGRMKRLCSILEPHALHFGNRAVEEIARYLQFAQQAGVLTAEAIDLQIEQKVLTKLRGGREAAAMLEALRNELKDLPTASKTIDRMRRDLENYDSFQYWS